MLKSTAEPPARYSVVGAVYVYDAVDPSTNVPTEQQSRTCSRRPAGSVLTVLGRVPTRGGCDRFRIEDEHGRTGWCNATDVWEHVSAC